MKHSATITSKGQLTLPAELRRELGLKVGDVVTFRKNAAGEIVLDAAPRTLGALFGALSVDAPVSADEIVDAVADARAARLETLVERAEADAGDASKRPRQATGLGADRR